MQHFDPFIAVCSMTEKSKGILAIFGPSSITSAPVVASICKKLEIPHIQTSWRPTTPYAPPISLNLYPAAHLLAKGLAVVLKHLYWKSYVILYERDDALIRLQEILKITNVGDNPVIMRKLDGNSNYR